MRCSYMVLTTGCKLFVELSFLKINNDIFCERDISYSVKKSCPFFEVRE
jgi:hypothetical protein